MGFAALALCALLGANLLGNGSFERFGPSGPEGWRVPGAMWRAGAVAIDRQVATDGEARLRITLSRQAAARVASPAISVEGGRWYRVSWKCRTHELDGSAGVQVWMGRPVMIDGQEQGGSFDWQGHEFVVFVPPGAERLQLQIVVRGKGAAWFDAVAVEPAERPQKPSPGLGDCVKRLGEAAGVEAAYAYPAAKVWPGDEWPPAKADAI